MTEYTATQLEIAQKLSEIFTQDRARLLRDIFARGQHRGNIAVFHAFPIATKTVTRRYL
jgi:hypothetical protein